MKNFAKLIAAAALATAWLPVHAESTKRVDKRQAKERIAVDNVQDKHSRRMHRPKHS